ncbi:MAG: HD domain-containing protein [Planctomycetes bacterium]|nr:HD domain-containing protein [Planctomycetota bacterium]
MPDELLHANDALMRHNHTLTASLGQRELELGKTRDICVNALAQLADSRDPETGEHLLRMQAFAQILAMDLAVHGPYTEQIDSQFLEDLWRSSPLHDIGKVGIPDEILLKRGRLTPAEFEIMKRHVLIGAIDSGNDSNLTPRGSHERS